MKANFDSVCWLKEKVGSKYEKQLILDMNELPWCELLMDEMDYAINNLSITNNKAHEDDKAGVVVVDIWEINSGSFIEAPKKDL